MSKENNILFQKFLDKQMSSEEVKGFEQRLIDDADFKEAFDLYVLLEGHVEEKVKYGDAVEVLRDVGEKKKRKENEPKVISLKFMLTIAASSLILFFVFNKTIFSSNEIPTHEDLYLSPAWDLDRSGKNDILQKSVQLLLSEDLSNAIKLLEKSNIGQDSINYWKAEYYVYYEKSDSALIYIAKNKPFKFAQERLTYLEIISEYSLGNYKIVKELIKRLPNDIDYVYINVCQKISTSIK